MSPQGSTLLEVMVALSMLSVIAAVATPAFLPALQKAKVESAAEEVAAFMEIARRRAVQSGRCHQLRVVDGRIRLDRNQHANCVSSMNWDQDVQSFYANDGVKLSNNSTTISPMAWVADFTVARIRPNGRVRGNGDLDNNDVQDFARIGGQHTSTTAQSEVLMTPIGRICVFHYSGSAPASLDTSRSCD